MKSTSLQIKILTFLSCSFVLVLVSVVFLNIAEQEKSIKHEVQELSHVIADAILNGIMFPMAQGNGEEVRKALTELKKDQNGGEILIFGHKKTAVYASSKQLEGTDLAILIKSPELAEAVQELLRTGKTADRVYEEWINGKPYLTLLQPILNETRCQQCHPGNQVAQGGLIVRQNMATIYGNISAQKYKSMGVALAGCLIIILILYFVIAKLVTHPIDRIIDHLRASEERLLACADQVASSNEGLAQGTTEQASAIEETSASLEEMSSMTRKNAENAGTVDSLMKETNNAVAQANNGMGRLTNSMNEISSASDEISKIIKTIDGIAFQTNLLALNAAVEAARAGDAGAGFAVVANEVRNLAMRAAEAAKNTAALIDGTVYKVKEGADLVTRTNTDFIEVAKQTEHAAVLTGEIMVASREQAQGIDQVSKAVVEVDKVVQANAAGAEESAAATQELNHLANEMKGAVAELVALIGGNRHGTSSPAGPVRLAVSPRTLFPH